MPYLGPCVKGAKAMHETDRVIEHGDTATWEGQLRLCFGQKAQQSQLLQSYQQAPLQVQRPFYPEGPGICHAIVLHNAGGIVGGDQLAIDVEVGPGASAVVTSASAGKIYRSRGTEAHQFTRMKLGSDACLEWLPQETIAFEGSRYRQDLLIELMPGAIWLGWEVIRFGRSARGERFLHGEWRSTTEVWQQGKPLWIDRQHLPGSLASWRSLHGLAEAPVIGSMVLLGTSVLPEVVEKVRALWAIENGRGEVGVTRLPAGLLCRYRGPSSAEAMRWFQGIWRLVRVKSAERTLCHPVSWFSTGDSTT